MHTFETSYSNFKHIEYMLCPRHALHVASTHWIYIRILTRCCALSSVLTRYCVGLVVYVLTRYCVGLVHVLTRYCVGLVHVLTRYCVGLVHVLTRYCVGLVHVLTRYCVGLVHVLTRYSVGLVKVKSSMARSLPVENLLSQNVVLSTTCSNVLKQPNGELLVAVNHN